MNKPTMRPLDGAFRAVPQGGDKQINRSKPDQCRFMAAGANKGDQVRRADRRIDDPWHRLAADHRDGF